MRFQVQSNKLLQLLLWLLPLYSQNVPWISTSFIPRLHVHEWTTKPWPRRSKMTSEVKANFEFELYYLKYSLLLPFLPLKWLFSQNVPWISSSFIPPIASLPLFDLRGFQPASKNEKNPATARFYNYLWNLTTWEIPKCSPVSEQGIDSRLLVGADDDSACHPIFVTLQEGICNEQRKSLWSRCARSVTRSPRP